MDYITTILIGIWHLMQGLYITMLNFFRKKVTEQYPENRKKVFPYTRIRGQLVMCHNKKNEHKCTACRICEMNCPNGTILIFNKKKINEVTGKEENFLDKYMYDIGSCSFCALCTDSCPQKAIKWSNNFEHAVFTRSKLVEQLNKINSNLMKKQNEPNY